MFQRLISRKTRGKSPGPSDGGAEKWPLPQTVEPWGLKVWAPGEDPSLDIVAIHGLNGHRDDTWAQDQTIWPRDFLSKRLPRARIMTWGYDARTHGRTQISRQLLADHAENLVHELSVERQLTGTQERPIIFIAHSLGGLVLKSALIHAALTGPGHLADRRAIFVSTYGILFVGTPHQGSDGVPWGQRLANIASIFVDTNTALLQHLARDSEFLQTQLGQYLSISDRFVTKFFYETLATPLPMGGSMMVVPRSSAVVPGARDAEAIPIIKNHRDMVKASSPDDANYKTLENNLVLMAAQASPVILERWQSERRDSTVHMHVAAQVSPVRRTVLPPPQRPAPPAAANPDESPVLCPRGEMTVLHRAASMGVNDMVKELLDSREVHPNARGPEGQTPLHNAAQANNAVATRYLLEAGADINALAGLSHGVTPLWCAAEKGSADAIEELLKHSPSIDLPNRDGQTALMAAAVRGHIDIVRMLLDAGADAHAREPPYGWTALHKSAINGQVGIALEILRRHPGDEAILEARSSTGAHPLHAATVSGSAAVVEALLDAGADIDAQEDNGITALWQAVDSSDIAVTRLLVSRGARTDLRRTNGTSPLEEARLKQNREILECLRGAVQQ